MTRIPHAAPAARLARIAVLALLAAAVAPAAHAASVVLRGGTVHPVSGPDIPGGSVLVVDGRITAVGPTVDAPASAVVVDCGGKHVYPGMISANTVLGLTEVGSVLGSNDTEETGTTNPNIRAQVEVNPESDLIPVTRVNGVTSALVIPRGGSISGLSALMHLAGWTWEDMTVRSPVGLHVRWPNMTPRRTWFETRTDEEQNKARDQAIGVITGAFDDARAYWKARDAEGQKSGAVPRHDRDVKWDAMGKALRGEIPVVIHASAYNQIRAALKFVDDQKLTNVILVSGGDAALLADDLKARNIGVICAGVLQMPARRSDPYDQAFTAPELLRQAGLRYCIADAGGAFEAANARNLPYNAAMAAAFGLPRDEALKSVTLYPAQILGVAQSLGSIEVGKRGDLVVTNGDLLDMATTVEKVFIDGEAISMSTRQTRLFEKYDHRPRNPEASKPKKK